MSIGIFYGSNGGNTETVAEKIASVLDTEVDLHDIGDVEVEKILEYDKIILGVSTWGEGELQDDWDDKIGDLEKLNLSGKTVALFGLGDQEGYGETFVDAIGTLYDAVVENGATVVGNGWSVDGYDFEESTAVRDGAFVGLAIDEDNQDELTEERIEQWTAATKEHLI